MAWDTILIIVYVGLVIYPICQTLDKIKRDTKQIKDHLGIGDE